MRRSVRLAFPGIPDRTDYHISGTPCILTLSNVDELLTSQYFTTKRNNLVL